jgi:hypothetical protein
MDPREELLSELIDRIDRVSDPVLKKFLFNYMLIQSDAWRRGIHLPAGMMDALRRVLKHLNDIGEGLFDQAELLQYAMDKICNGGYQGRAPEGPTPLPHIPQMGDITAPTGAALPHSPHQGGIPPHTPHQGGIPGKTVIAGEKPHSSLEGGS